MFIFVSAAPAAELSIPQITGTQGETVKLHVFVNKVDNLAGIKLALVYDKNILKYVKAEKTTHTANMLYVVNDKVPGRLIIVMAATKGLAGEDVALVQMTFELLKDVKKEEKVTLQIIEAELMSDKLKRIEITSQ
jgi:glutamine phosphoribosylpyrophosphate amidotransferase